MLISSSLRRVHRLPLPPVGKTGALVLGLAIGLAGAGAALVPLRAARGDSPAHLLPNPYGSTPSATPAPPDSDPAAGSNGASPGRPIPGAAGRPTASADLPRPPKDAAARREWLRARLDELFGAAWLSKSKVSVLVVESDTGRPIYARGDKTLVNAASNVKLVTSAAALSLLGPEYRWKTTAAVAAAAQGPPLLPGGELAGDLYVRGLGDPTLTTEDLSSMV